MCVVARCVPKRCARAARGPSQVALQLVRSRRLGGHLGARRERGGGAVGSGGRQRRGLVSLRSISSLRIVFAERFYLR